MSVECALAELGELGPGDVVCVNDPFRGGTHLPDITLISSVRDSDGKLLGYVASRAHHSDVGGSTPGSMPLAREIFEEGIRIPPVRLYRDGERNEDLWRTILANVRTPEERAGDLDAQLAALHTGAGRLLEIAARRGTAKTLAAMDSLIAYADRLVAAGLAMIPDGRYEGVDAIEDDGFGSGPVPIRATLTLEGSSLTIDFEGTSPQVPGGVNAVAAITASATRYVVRCVVEALLGEPLPAGGGSMTRIHRPRSRRATSRRASASRTC
jgi:N-methylhydantoinase B